MKICQLGAKLLHADWKTDMTKLIVALHNFANAPTDLRTYADRQNASAGESSLRNAPQTEVPSKRSLSFMCDRLSSAGGGVTQVSVDTLTASRSNLLVSILLKTSLNSPDWGRLRHATWRTSGVYILPSFFIYIYLVSLHYFLLLALQCSCFIISPTHSDPAHVC